jgi:hypothetical protein
MTPRWWWRHPNVPVKVIPSAQIALRFHRKAAAEKGKVS